MAISTTLFLFIHTRDLHTKLKAMEVKLQPEDVLSGKCVLIHFNKFNAPDAQAQCLFHVTGQFAVGRFQKQENAGRN
jgi:hypothetical protein